MVAVLNTGSRGADTRQLKSLLDWRRAAYTLMVSRRIDDLEENTLLPARKLLYQFSARGHDLAQILLGCLLNHRCDAASGYYRSRPLLLTLGLPLTDAVGSPMMRAGGMSGGRDIGVVFNLPNAAGPCVLPVCGGVGAQYTPAAGWAQSLRYRREVLNDTDCSGSIAVVLGGDSSVASNGFWSALTIATTERLPVLFYIEDNGYGISVPSDRQTPGGNIATNLSSFQNLLVLDGDGADPQQAALRLLKAVGHVRGGEGPALLRLSVPRLCGHSAQDTQTYKSEQQLASERARDPLPRLRSWLVPSVLSEKEWQALKKQACDAVDEALDVAESMPEPDPREVTRFAFSEHGDDGKPELQQQGGLWPLGHAFPAVSETPQPEAQRINMLTAIRRTLAHELAVNPRVVVFGEDVGPKGGVHAATLGLQDRFGESRVFDTSLSEEGIIGRAAGMAAAGLMPVPEIQFRKYADPAEEQLNDIGTMRWRTRNRFAAPMVVRMPGGFFKCGDPWHSHTGEVKWTHAVGWQLAMPSNAADAVGLLRFALRDNNPTIFFEHRALLDAACARQPYPGDDYVLPFGKAGFPMRGNDMTVVSWGAMVARCQSALEQLGVAADLIDLRTLSPWDSEAVLASVRRTRRCLIVHEDNLTAGFGAEVAATVSESAFMDLDAPVRRVAMPDVPSPHSPLLMNAVIPGVERIASAVGELADF